MTGPDGARGCVDRILDEVCSAAGASQARLCGLAVGPYWTVVHTTVGAGLASTMGYEWHHDGGHAVREAGRLHTRTPLELAGLLSSSSQPEAAIGLATVNALLGAPTGTVTLTNAADVLRERGAGRVVGLVGRFPFADTLRRTCRELWIFEQGPRRRPDDFAAEHVEELVPHVDVLAVSATALLNGTMDGIVRLARGDALIVMLGPSTPFARSLFDVGFDVLCGTVVEDAEAVLRAASQGAVTGQIPGVRRMCLWRPGSDPGVGASGRG